MQYWVPEYLVHVCPRSSALLHVRALARHSVFVANALYTYVLLLPSMLIEVNRYARSAVPRQ